MNYHVRFFPVTLLLLTLSSAANAQSNQTKPVAPGKDRSSKSAKNADADRVIREDQRPPNTSTAQEAKQAN